MVVNAEVNQTNKTTLRSARRSVVENSLTGPTLLEMSGLPGGLNGSTQHWLEVYLQGAQQLKVCGER